MTKDELDLKVRNLFHDAKNKIGIMSGYAQCIYMLPDGWDIATMPPERIAQLYSNAMETSRNIQRNSVLAQALLNELHDIVYRELKIDKSKPRLKRPQSSGGKSAK